MSARTGSRSRALVAQRQAASDSSPLVGREHERARLDEILAAVREGGSAALVLRGDPGVGKSALLHEVIASASGFQVVRAVGVEGEVDLPYAALQQLCRPMLDTIDALPEPQREALRVAFGLTAGEPADRYLVGLATLGLMSETAATQPLLCVVDDAQWLDLATTRALAFVARRLGADSVGLLFAAREAVTELEGVPELQLDGLKLPDARALLDATLVGHLDPAVRERFLAETHGNPLALLELPRTLTPAEAATGILRQTGDSLSGRIEDSFGRRLEPLSHATRRLLLLAAAEPLGDPLLLLRAAAHLGLDAEAADAAEEAALLEIRDRCSFCHPLARSAVYRQAAPRERRRAHAALAEATDAESDPDRRAWHRAQATAAPDEDVAAELERTAARAKARGGLAAAGAFLERAALLTPSPHKRARRSLAAAEVLYEAGAFAAAESLLRSIDTAQLSRLDAARAECLDAEASIFVVGVDQETTMRLLAAGARLSRLDPSLGQAAQFLALGTATQWGNPEMISAVAKALSEVPAMSGGPVELFARGWAQLLGQGYPAGTDLLRRALAMLCEKPSLEEQDLSLLLHVHGIAVSTWDFDSWESLIRRSVQLARDSGALRMLPAFLHYWSMVNVAAGQFAAAAAAVAEADALSEAISEGQRGGDESWLDAWRLEQPEALRSIERLETGRQKAPYHYDHARALIYNGAAQYEAALHAAQRSCDGHPVGTYTWALVELVEASMRCGHADRGRDALKALVDRTRPAGTEWALGLEARSAALVTDDPAAAELLYREAVERLGRARTRPDLARAHLVYGEWLRRENRRLDAREQLRTAHDLFVDIGIPGFADRAARELAATGETARKRTDDTRADLTPHESQIAQLAAEGLTNPEIGAKLYLSPRTVEWHLRRVYPKLGIRSRKELRAVLRTT